MFSAPPAGTRGGKGVRPPLARELPRGDCEEEAHRQERRNTPAALDHVSALRVAIALSSTAASAQLSWKPNETWLAA